MIKVIARVFYIVVPVINVGLVTSSSFGSLAGVFFAILMASIGVEYTSPDLSTERLSA